MALLRGLRQSLGLRRVRWPAHVTIGRHSYGLTPRSFARATAEAPIAVGNFCSFGDEVLILGQADHRIDLPSTFPFRPRLFAPEAPNRDAVTRGAVTIGHDVWVGSRAIVLSGVSIGNGAVIGAGSVVTRDVEPFAVVAGNPARFLRHRFPPEIVAALQRIAWWNWPDEKLRQFEAALYGDVREFIAKAAP